MSKAFQSELSQFRSFNRGNVLVGTVTFVCEEPTCPATQVKIGFSEEMGQQKPFQWGLLCPRCRAPFGRYIGLEKGR